MTINLLNVIYFYQDDLFETLKIIPFVIKFHQNIYPFISLEENEVYYCPGHNNNVNSTDVLRVYNYDVYLFNSI